MLLTPWAMGILPLLSLAPAPILAWATGPQDLILGSTSDSVYMVGGGNDGQG